MVERLEAFAGVRGGWVRVVAVFAVIAGFVLIAAWVRPTGSQAGGTFAEDEIEPAGDALVPGSLGSIEGVVPEGALAGERVTVEMFAGGDEPVYTVRRADGEVLVDRATAYEIEQRLPGLAIGDLYAGAHGMVDIPLD